MSTAYTTAPSLPPLPFRSNRWDLPLAELHDRFLLSLKVERNASELTLASYRSDFSRFVRFLSEQSRRKRPELRGFTADLLRDYQLAFGMATDREGRHPSPNTVNRHLASLSSFGGWCVRWNYLQANPVKKLIRAKRVKTVKRPLTLEEVALLFRLSMPRAEAAMRDLMLYAGLRRGELVALEWRDLNSAEEYLHVRGKGRKERALGIAAPLKATLDDYALAVGPKSPTGPVFLGRYGRRIDRHVINAIVRRWGQAISRPGLHPHLFRTTYTTYFSEGQDPAIVMDALGHESFDTTRIYIASRPQRVKVAMQGFRYGVEAPRP